MTRVPYVVVDGNIGVGKSTVVERLRSAGFRVMSEPVEEWCAPFEFRGRPVPSPLQSMYEGSCDRASYAFQVFVLATRLEQMRGIKNVTDIVVFERDPFDEEVFTEHNARKGWTPLEHNAYVRLVRAAKDVCGFKKIGTVYLRLEPEDCMVRIAGRGREQENTLSMAALRDIHLLYEKKYADLVSEGGVTVDASVNPDKLTEYCLNYMYRMNTGLNI